MKFTSKLLSVRVAGAIGFALAMVLAFGANPGVGVVHAQPDNDISVSLTKDEHPGDGIPLGDIIFAGTPHQVAVDVEVQNGFVPDDIELFVSIAGPVACDPQWIGSSWDWTNNYVSGPDKISEARDRGWDYAAFETRHLTIEYEVDCPAGDHNLEIVAEVRAYFHGTTSEIPDPNWNNNEARNQPVVTATISAVGGVVELRAGSSDAPAAASGSGSSSDYALPVAAAVAGAIFVLTASGWYARRRWLR